MKVSCTYKLCKRSVLWQYKVWNSETWTSVDRVEIKEDISDFVNKSETEISPRSEEQFFSVDFVNKSVLYEKTNLVNSIRYKFDSPS